MSAIPSDRTHRLALIKSLLSGALDHAGLPEPFSAKAVLELHDATELFLALVAEHLDVSLSKKAEFLEYWPAVSAKLGAELPMQSAMKRLNQARVSLKHSGIRPSSSEISDLAQKTLLFFEQSSQLVFGKGLDGLSAISLVGYEPTASRLREAERLEAHGRFELAAQLCAIAFEDVMHRFRLVTAEDRFGRSPFPRLSELTHFSVMSVGYEWSKENKELVRHLEKISAAFADIKPALLMQAMGIDYREYARFYKLMPHVDGMADGSHVVSAPRATLTARDLVFAIDFVCRAAVAVRELDANAPTTSGTEAFVINERFEVTLPSRGSAPERTVRGQFVQLGGDFEAWIFHGQQLARVFTSSNQADADAYLEKYRVARIADAEREKR